MLHQGESQQEVLLIFIYIVNILLRVGQNFLDLLHQGESQQDGVFIFICRVNNILFGVGQDFLDILDKGGSQQEVNASASKFIGEQLPEIFILQNI